MRLTARGRLAVTTLTSVVMLGAVVLLTSMHEPAADPAVSGPEAQGGVITVLPGDTLWSVARRVDPAGNTGDVVATLRRLNRSDG